MPSPHLPASRRGLVRVASAAGVAAVLVGGPLAISAQAAVAPPLATASAFSVLAGSTVTNTGPTTVSRGIGLSPGSAVANTGKLTVGGTYHVADAVALQAKADLTTAYNDAYSQVNDEVGGTDLAGAELTGLTLTPGAYDAPGVLSLTGELTLDAQGNGNAVWIFGTDSTLIAGSGARITLTNGASACNVYWQVGSSATLGTNSRFVGNIMAEASVTMTTGATLQGRALAQSAAVTLDSNTITGSGCANEVTVPAGTTTPPSAAPTPTPTPTATPTPSGTTGTNGGTGAATDTTTGTTTTTQVTEVPTGSVDTGYVGADAGNDRTNSGLVGGGILAMAGAVALFAVRRRQRV